MPVKKMNVGKNLVAIYDIDGANEPVMQSDRAVAKGYDHCGVVINTQTCQVSHLLTRTQAAMAVLAKETAVDETAAVEEAPAAAGIPIGEHQNHHDEAALQKRFPVYFDRIVFYQIPVESPVGAEDAMTTLHLPKSIASTLAQCTSEKDAAKALNAIKTGKPQRPNARKSEEFHLFARGDDFASAAKTSRPFFVLS